MAATGGSPGPDADATGSRLRAVGEAMGVTVLAFVIAFLAGNAFAIQVLSLGYDLRLTVVLLAATAVSQLGMLAVGYAFLRYGGRSVRFARPTWRTLGYVVGGFVAALVVAVGLSALLAVLGLLPQSVIGEVATMDPTYLLGLAALSVVVVAPVEEFVFRGVVQGRLRERFGPTPAIAGASLLFGSMHLANYAGDPASVVAGALTIAAVGAVFGTVYERTDTLLAPVLVHASYNVVLLLASYAATAGA